MATTIVAPATIPGPDPMPVVGWRGNLMQLHRDPIGYMRRLNQRYGDIVASVRGHRGTIFAFGPEYNQQLLGNPALFHSTGITVLGPEGSALRRLGFGLFRMNGDQHKQQRRLVMPAFHRKAIEAYRDAMVAINQHMLGTWKVGQLRDMSHEMRQLAFRIASKTLFSLDHAQEADGFGRMIRRWLRLNASIPVGFFPIDLPGTPYRRMIVLSERLETRILEIIRQRRANPSNVSDLLSMLLEAHGEDGAKMTDAELTGHINILLVAAHETNYVGLIWTLFLLSQHPRIMGDLFDELSSVLRGDAPTVDQLGDLPLLDRVIKESMRVLPPVVFTTRTGIEPFKLGPHCLPKGSIVGLGIYTTHHMPELYSQPEKFLPDRWLTIDPSPYEYLPFGAGPRKCIGALLAMVTIKISLAMILQRYRLTLAPGARIDRNARISLSPKRGMPMMIVAQDRRFMKSSVRGNIHEMVDLA